MADPRPGRIRLSPERRAALMAGLQRDFEAEFDEPLSAFRAEALIDFFVERLGPAVYNQACATQRRTCRTSSPTSRARSTSRFTTDRRV